MEGKFGEDLAAHLIFSEYRFPRNHKGLTQVRLGHAFPRNRHK